MADEVARAQAGRWQRVLAVPVVALSLLVSSVAVAPSSGAYAGFGDVEGAAFYTRAVQWMVDNDITKGVTTECFEPYAPIDRGQAAVFMWRMKGEPTPSGLHGFSDVPAWMSEAVAWMVEEGVTLGTTPTTFSPGQILTRAELVTLLWRLAGQPAPASTVHPFTDLVPGAFFYTAVLWAVEQGITKGTTDTTFSPGDSVTRGQVATVFYRYKGEPAVVVDPASPGCAGVRTGIHGQWFRLNPWGASGPYEIETLDCTGQGAFAGSVQCAYVAYDDDELDTIVGTGEFVGSQVLWWQCLPYIRADGCNPMADFIAKGRTTFSSGQMPEVTLVVRPDSGMTVGWDSQSFHCPWFTTVEKALTANPAAAPDCVGI